MFFSTKFLFFLFCINISQIAFASWNRLETEHFRLLVHAEHIETGKYIAEESERAYHQLKKIYSEFPTSKILIVVEHRTDLANGSASNFPYPHIVLYPTLPNTYSSIGEYKEWVYELVLHELVHFLSFFPVHGVYKPLNWLFGNYISPNFIMLPAWWHEGLAVHLETHLTHGGRMRSAHYSEMAKALSSSLASGDEDLNRINERYIPSFPYGQRPYFYGSLVFNQALKEAEPQDIDRLVQSYSRMLPPYNLYSSTKKHLKTHFRAARKSVERYTYPTDEGFTFLGEQPRLLDPQTLITNYLDKNLFNNLIKYDLSQKKPTPEVWVQHQSLGRFEISQDKSLILFDAIAPYQRRYQTSDLFLYDIKNKTKKRLTTGLRVREATLAADNSTAIAIKLNLAQSELCRILLKAEKPTCEVLYTPPLGTRLSFPEYLSADEVVFIEKPNNEKSLLKILNLNTRHMSTINTQEFQDIYWAKPRGKQLTLQALAQDSDTRQVYIQNGARWTPLSHDPVGIAGFDFDHGHLSLSRVTPTGYKVKVLQNIETTGTAPSTPSPSVQEESPSPPYTLNSNFLASSESITKPEVQVKDDSLWPYMLPHYWIPFIYPNYGGFSDHFIMTFSTGSTDPLRRHSYNITLAHDTISKRLGGSMVYTNYSYQHPWGLYVSQMESPLTDTLSRTYQRAGVFTDLELVELDSNLGGLSLRLSADYNNAQLRGVVDDLKTFGVTARLSYDDIAGFPADVAPISGQFVSLAHSYFFESSDMFGYNYSELYFEKFFSKYVAPPKTSWKLFGKGIMSDQFLPPLLAPINYSGYFASSRYQRDFVIRGYPSGVFRAYEGAFNLGLEFNFPILNSFRSFPFEALPLLFKRIYGTAFVDYGQVKGDYYDGASSAWIGTDFDKAFAGYGIEIHTEWTLLHHVPLKLSLGIFNPIHKIPGVATGSQIFLNFATPSIPN
ncbi:MAG: hypothetical protein M9899_08155 [Bdellovibrionaceae bacterium]|nr:hypothetical protein [Pseudobdellovibrionaceae bacterium]